MSGSQLCQLLRQQYAYRGIIVGCSGDANAELFLREGANVVWSKPPPPNEEITRGLLAQFECISAERRGISGESKAWPLRDFSTLHIGAIQTT
jgi:hypothetical protein